MADILPEAQEFLDERVRQGFVTTLRRDGSPCTVPLWYDWDGTTVRFISGVTSPKLKRLANDPRITLTVASETAEAEKWVSFEGRATVSQEGVKDLASALAARYWGDDPTYQQTIAGFEAAPAEYFMLVEFVPERGQTMLGDDLVQNLFQA